MPVSVLPGALTSFLFEIIFWSLFSGKLATILWCLIFMMDLTNFFWRLNVDGNPRALQWADVIPQKPHFCSWQESGSGWVWVWREVCVGGGIAWAGCCPLTNLPSFLTTVKITVLLSNKNGINQNPTGPLLYNRTIEGLLPLPRKCLSDIWVSVAEAFLLLEPNDKNLAKAFSYGKP